MEKDLLFDSDVTQCIASILSASTTDINGAAVDLIGANGCEFVANCGISLDTLSVSVYYELELEHSDDDSTYTDCADADLVSAVTGTNTGCWGVINSATQDPCLKTVRYIGGKRYVRPVLNKTGTHTNGVPIGVVGRRYALRAKP